MPEEIPQYDGMKAIVNYKCEICDAEVSSEDAPQHSRLPNPKEVAFNFPDNLILLKTSNGYYMMIKKQEGHINQSNHDVHYQLHFYLPSTSYNGPTGGDSLHIKREIEDGVYRQLTQEEFEKFKEEYLEKNKFPGEDIFIRTTPELEALVAQEVPQ